MPSPQQSTSLVYLSKTSGAVNAAVPMNDFMDASCEKFFFAVPKSVSLYTFAPLLRVLIMMFPVFMSLYAMFFLCMNSMARPMSRQTFRTVSSGMHLLCCFS